MWVVSQDKKTTMRCLRFKVSKSFGGAGKKYCIIGQSLPAVSGGTILNYFATEEEALKELDNLVRAIANGDRFYDFR